MTPEDEKKLFELEQQLDIPYKNRYYNKDDKRNYKAEQPVKNCNIPCVSNSVCEHDWKRTGDPDRQSCRCTKCGEYDG